MCQEQSRHIFVTRFLDEKMTFNDLLKKWNGGKLRGAQTNFAAAIGVKPNTVSQWASGSLPGEEQRERIAKHLGITVDELVALFSRGFVVADSGGAYGITMKHVPVVGVVGAASFSFNFDDPPLEYLPVVIEGSAARRYAAFRIQGDCMAPRFHDGEVVIVAESGSVPDGVPGVFCLDGECTLKIPQRHADRVELRPLNPKYKSIEVKTNKLVVMGVVVGVWRKP
jgi:SOS-response transcriptional repressor LexA